MTRSVWNRALALFAGLWFVAVSAGPEFSHACPLHGHGAMAASIGGHGAHHVPGASVSHHDASNTQSPSDSGHCTCLGHCCSAPPVALVATPAALVDVATSATRDAGLPDYAYVPVAAEHVLPLANGPPLAA